MVPVCAPAFSRGTARHCGVLAGTSAGTRGYSRAEGAPRRWRAVGSCGVLVGYSRGTAVLERTAAAAVGRGLRVRCRRAQAHMCSDPDTATSARRAPCGSRPRRRAAPLSPPRARLWCRLLLRPPLPTRGAATHTTPTLRTSTPTPSVRATNSPSCCAPPSAPVRHDRAHVDARGNVHRRAQRHWACGMSHRGTPR
jgi:hypothetical protein